MRFVSVFLWGSLMKQSLSRSYFSSLSHFSALSRSFARTASAAILLMGMSGAAMASSFLSEPFEYSDFSSRNVLFYKDNKEQRAGRYEFQSDMVRSGRGAVRLEVDEHCSSDDEGCSERAELWEQSHLRRPYGTGTWYSFSVLLADPVPQGDRRHVLAQWKRAIDRPAGQNSSPFLAIRMRQGVLYVTAETHLLEPLKNQDGSVKRVCGPGEARIWNRPEDGQSRVFIAGNADRSLDRFSAYNACTDQISITHHGSAIPSVQSGWIDFAAYVEPDPDGAGRIEVFANNNHIATVTGAIGHRDLGPTQYFKIGPYREGHNEPWAFFVDNFARSASCSDILPTDKCPL